jgi:hypothetical protein
LWGVGFGCGFLDERFGSRHWMIVRPLAWMAGLWSGRCLC